MPRTDHALVKEQFPTLPFETGPYTFPAGHAVVVVVTFVNEVGAAPDAAGLTIDDNGADLVWTPRVVVDSGVSASYSPGLVMFTTIGNGNECSLIFNKSGALGRLLAKPYSWDDADESDPFGATMVEPNAGNVVDGAFSSTLNDSPADTSEVLAVIAGTVSGTNLTSVTPGAGWTEILDEHDADYSLTQIQFRIGGDDEVAWLDVLETGDGYFRSFIAGALEIKKNSGVGTATGAGQTAIATAPDATAGSPNTASGSGATATASAPSATAGAAALASGAGVTDSATAPAASATGVTVTITGLRLIGKNRAPMANLTNITALVHKQIPSAQVAPDKWIAGVSTDAGGVLSNINLSDIQSTSAQVWLTLLKSPNLATTVLVTPVVT